MIATSRPFSQSGNDLADSSAQGADSTLRASQRTASQAVDDLTDKVHEVRDQAAPVINRVAAKAEELARRSADVVKDRSMQLRESATRASDSTIGYIKDEPVKSILIAAAAGAALMALLSLMSRDRH